MATTVKHRDLNAFFGDEDHLKLSQGITFTEMIFRLLSEKVPNQKELKLFNLILNLSIDHGPDTPSAIKTIEHATKKQTISESVAEGIKQINDSHGGAIEPAMRIFYKIKDNKDNSAVSKFIKDSLKDGQKIPGFGHRIYKDKDPRAQLILDKIKQIYGKLSYIDIAIDIQDQLNKLSGKTLPLNIDGAIAIALCAFGWEPQLGKAFFIITRTPGLCGHYIENSKKP